MHIYLPLSTVSFGVADVFYVCYDVSASSFGPVFLPAVCELVNAFS